MRNRYIGKSVSKLFKQGEASPVKTFFNNQITSHTSEISQIFKDPKVFENMYSHFLEQADKNNISGKANGGKTPYGLADNKCDNADLTTHFGQGGAGTTPYLNWHVVSLYYIVDESRILMGIEKDRYKFIKQMSPLRYEKFKNRKTEMAVFYETMREKIDYTELCEKFIEVSEQVMRLGLYLEML